MKTPVSSLVEMLFTVAAQHPLLAFCTFVTMSVGPLLVWLRSGGGGPGSHRPGKHK